MTLNLFLIFGFSVLYFLPLGFGRSGSGSILTLADCLFTLAGFC